MSRFALSDLPPGLREQAMKRIREQSRNVTTVEHRVDGEKVVKSRSPAAEGAAKDEAARQERILRDTSPKMLDKSPTVRKRTRHKYNAQPTYALGIRFHSKKEAERYVLLKSFLERGAIRNLERQVKYEIKVNGILVTRYYADFRYERKRSKRGKVEWESVVEDVKGMRSGVPYRLFLLKKDLLLATHGVKISVI